MRNLQKKLPHLYCHFDHKVLVMTVFPNKALNDFWTCMICSPIAIRKSDARFDVKAQLFLFSSYIERWNAKKIYFLVKKKSFPFREYVSPTLSCYNDPITVFKDPEQKCARDHFFFLCLIWKKLHVTDVKEYGGAYYV